jgi:hypothetical protein
MRVALGALAMYPDETCFDVTRPSWLPYWIDDITESQCKVNLVVSGNTTGNTAQAGQVTAVTNPDGTTSVVQAADPATIQNAMAACANSGGTWNTTLGVCEPSFISQYGMYIGLGALALIVGVVALKL